jgi:16S rRNA (cytosine1407-C5)-methyltransferase
LKPGGILVYSTCSLQKQQNEDVVEYLLNLFPQTAKLEDLPFNIPEVSLASKILEKCCLFDPKISGTSGQFIASIRKVG